MKGTLIDCNQSSLDITGYKKEELIGEHFTKLPTIQARDIPRYIETFAALMQGKVPGRFVTALNDKGGTERWAEVCVSLIKTGNTKRKIIQVISRDITERRRLEETLLQSEKRYQLLVDNVATGISVVQDGRIKFANKQLETITGYSVIDLYSIDGFTLIHPEDQDFIREYHVRRAKGEKVPDSYSLRIIRKDGAIRWLGRRVSTIVWEGKPATLILDSDITERKQMEEALKESEQRYLHAEELGRYGHFSRHIGEEKVTWSKGTYRIFGVDPDEFEVTRTSFLEFVNPSDKEAVLKANEDARLYGKKYDIEYRITRPDGAERVLHAVADAIEDEAGKPKRMFGTVQDVTKHKQAEDALREAQELYGAVLELGGRLGEAIVLLQDDERGTGMHVYMNDVWCDITGYSREELLDISMADLIHPRDRDAAVARYARRLSGEDIPDLIELSIIRKNGTEVPVEVTYAHSTYKGKSANVGFIREISERKKAEEQLTAEKEKLQAMVSGLARSGIGIDIVGRDYRVQFQNEALQEKFGNNIGKLCYETYMALKKPCDFCPMVEAIRNNKTASVELTAADGRDYELLSTPLPNPDGTIDRAIEVIRDITERKRAEVYIQHINTVLRAVRNINQLITRERDTQKLIRRSCELLTEGRGYYNAWIALFDESGKLARHAESGLGEGFLSMVEKMRRGELTECTRKALGQPEVVPTEDPTSTCIDCPLVRNYAGRGALTVRIEYSGIILGVLSASVPIVYVSDKQEGELLQEVAKDISLALQNIKLEKQRLQGEVELRASEEYNRTILNNSPIPTLVANSDTSIQYVNPALEKLTGFALAELIGRKAPYPWWPEEGKLELMQGLQEGIQYGHRGIERIFQKKNGDKLWVEITSTSVIAVGDYRYYIANWVDITERKRAEEEIRKFKAIADQAPYGVTISSPEGELIYVNKAYAGMHGFTPEELIGRHISILYTEAQMKRTQELKNQILQAGSYTAEEVWHRRKDDTLFPTLMSAHLLKDDNGNPLFMTATAIDITERKKMQAQLVVTDRLASIGELASGIAHELNNPLTGVIGFSELLMGRDIPGEIKEDLQVINREAKRTAQVVRNLLTFARGEPENKEPVDINKIIQKILQMRAYEHRAHNIEVNTRLAPDLPEIIANGFQLQQTFLNIIINAEHFMIESHGRGTLTVTTEQIGGKTRVSFADDGPGIAPESIDRLFDPFFTTKEVGKGTGLGLSIAHGIITEHGGNIYAESEPGKGAAFIIELPVKVQAKGKKKT